MATVHITYQQRGYCPRNGYRRLAAVLDDCRHLYNAALQERRDAYRYHGHTVTWVDQNRSLTDIRADWPDHEGAVDRRVQRGVLRRLDRAYASFFRRVKAGAAPGFPRFKPASRYRTIDVEAPTATMLRVSSDERKAWVRVKGLPSIEIRTKRPFPSPSAIKSLRIVWQPTGVWVDLVFEVEREPLPALKSAVGVDMGISDRMALSTGEVIERRPSGRKIRRGRSVAPAGLPAESRTREDTPAIAQGEAPCVTDAPFRMRGGPLPEREAVRVTDAPACQPKYPPSLTGAPVPAPTRVVALQQSVSRKQKGSNSRRKVVKTLARARFRERIRNRNECHRITTDIVRRFGHIAVEALTISNMVRSAKGTIAQPGVNVAAKSGLNREIQTQTWGLIREQLRYKAAWAGREFVEVDPKYTSQLCSRCGLNGERKDKRFSCANCGLRWDADNNAAVNVMQRAFGPTVRRPQAGNAPGQVALLPA